MWGCSCINNAFFSLLTKQKNKFLGRRWKERTRNSVVLFFPFGDQVNSQKRKDRCKKYYMPIVMGCCHNDYRRLPCYIIKLVSHACLKLALTTRIIKIKISWFLFPPKHYFFFLIFLFEKLSFLASLIKKKKCAMLYLGQVDSHLRLVPNYITARTIIQNVAKAKI